MKALIKETLITVLLTTSLAMTVFGCGESDGPAEEAGEQVDQAVEQAGDKLEEAGDKAEDKTD